MQRILFTKKYSIAFLNSEFNNSYKIESEDFIEIIPNDLNEILNQIHPEISNQIVSSYNAAKILIELNLNGYFYCVGKKSAELLQNANKKVVLTAPNANNLVGAISKKVKNSQKFQFFCSDIRRNEIPNGLKELGHSIQEIICYQTIAKKVELKNEFDAYVFFSPSGVKSFAEQYKIPTKALIFALGETTKNAVEVIFNRNTMIPQKPSLELLIQLIKEKLNAKK